MDYPNMVEWVEDIGFAELHRRHNMLKPQAAFGAFVEENYKDAKQKWHSDMSREHEIDIPFDIDGGEVDIESAKQVLKKILEAGIEDHMIVGTILTDDLAVDCSTAVLIVDAFWSRVIPAVENAVNKL